jgi:hypothetical protein
LNIPYGQAAVSGQIDYTAGGRYDDSWRHGLFRKSLIGMLLDVQEFRTRYVYRSGDGTRRVPATWEWPNETANAEVFMSTGVLPVTQRSAWKTLGSQAEQIRKLDADWQTKQGKIWQTWNAIGDEYRSFLDGIAAESRPNAPVNLVNTLKQYIAEERESLQSAQNVKP